MLALISGSSAFFKSSLYIWKFSVHVLLYLLWFDLICSVTQLCLTLCSPMDCSTPGFPVLQHLLEFAQTHVHWVVNAIHPSHPLSSPSPPALNLSHHQGLFQLVNSASGGQNIRASASASVLPMNIQGWFRLELTGLISLLSKGLSRIFPNTTVRSISCSALRAG